MNAVVLTLHLGQIDAGCLHTALRLVELRHVGDNLNGGNDVASLDLVAGLHQQAADDASGLGLHGHLPACFHAAGHGGTLHEVSPFGADQLINRRFGL